MKILLNPAWSWTAVLGLLSLAAGQVLAHNAPSPTPGAPEGEPQWEQVAYKDGITVWAKEREGRPIPTFRGVGLVDASVLEVMAIYEDPTRHTEWMHACLESRVVERASDTEAIWYNLINAPWPVSNRDLVVHSTITVSTRRQIIWNHFRAISHPAELPKKGVVRVPWMEGFFKFEYVNPQKTRVTYQVSTDPGGWIPHWLARLASKDLPIKTIRNLRRQVERTRGSYNAFIARWSKDHGLTDYVNNRPQHGATVRDITAERE